MFGGASPSGCSTDPAGNTGTATRTFIYFRFVDYTAFELGHRLTPGEIAYFVVGFVALGALVWTLAAWWARPLEAGPPPPGPAGNLARRRAVHLPLALAAITLLAWTLAGIIWGIGWPLINGTLVPVRAVRTVFGITVNASLRIKVSSMCLMHSRALLGLCSRSLRG